MLWPIFAIVSCTCRSFSRLFRFCFDGFFEGVLFFAGLVGFLTGAGVGLGRFFGGVGAGVGGGGGRGSTVRTISWVGFGGGRGLSLLTRRGAKRAMWMAVTTIGMGRRTVATLVGESHRALQSQPLRPHFSPSGMSQNGRSGRGEVGRSDHYLSRAWRLAPPQAGSGRSLFG